MKMLISAGGTGGHIMPAVAIAHELSKRPGWDIHWMGGNGMEESIISKNKIPFHKINISAFRGAGLMRKVKYPFTMIRALFQAIKIIIEIKPNGILVSGGYTGVPAAFAGALLHKPIFIQEQNTHSGMATLLTSLIASRIYRGFPKKDSSGNSSGKDIFCGNPTPLAYEMKKNPCVEIQERYKKRKGSMRIFVTGGSQGAEVFNLIIPSCLAQFPKKSFQVRHQSGKGKLEQTVKLYNKYKINARVDDFITSMKDSYCWADLVIARAGALTLAELAMVGVASILVPFPYAADDHQMKNAKIFVDKKAAIVLAQKDFSVRKLGTILAPYISNKEDMCYRIRVGLINMAMRMNSMAKPDAASCIVDDITQIMKCV